MVLIWKNTLFYKFGASNPAFLDKRPNNLLFQKLIELGQIESYDCIDLGLSNQEGLIRFKDSIGGAQKEILFLSNTTLVSDQEKQFRTYNKNLVGKILSTKPTVEEASSFSEIIYPYFT
jgi:hypothetical protein